jgi:hypothetical protein
MLRKVKVCLLCGLVVLAATVISTADAKAATVVYDNGGIGAGGAFPVWPAYSVSDSFTLSAATTLTSAQIGLWTQYLPTTLDWSIGTTPFSSDISSGTGTLANTFVGTSGGYLVYESTFPLTTPSPLAASATYWLTLQNDPLHSVYWSLSAGPNPSAAYGRYGADPASSLPSESFQLYGSVVPEPGTLMLLGSSLVGLVSVVYLRWRGAKV